jgi:hypothetical protein
MFVSVLATWVSIGLSVCFHIACIYIYIYIYETRVGFAKVCRINENTNNWHRANKIGQPANQPVSQPGTHHSASQPAASRPAQPSPAQLHAAQPPAQPSPAQATLASQPDLRRPACCQRSPSLHLLRWTSFFSTCRTCMQEVHHPGRLQCRQSGTVPEEPQKLPAKPPASHASQRASHLAKAAQPSPAVATPAQPASQSSH